MAVPTRSSLGGHSAALTCSMVAFAAESLLIQSAMVGWPSELLVTRGGTGGTIPGSTLMNIGVEQSSAMVVNKLRIYVDGFVVDIPYLLITRMLALLPCDGSYSRSRARAPPG
ncbi:hypothetical protein NA56DRAFT_713131 [Hyaloscypha hepaticicola]|uniref:Uncharacterized protein n=1 Tax=Hyaloscypha hepaticicola TaxID=2082293 RepID=A0A2J6PF18_9HELO|nr:hypothetical protein NA56DRAFT_713131 [Hyaloscypha hepaticicola]